MNYKAVIVETEYTRDVEEFLKRGRIVHTNQEYVRKDILGLRKLMGSMEAWGEEYYKYWGVEFVLIKEHGWIVGSGRLKWANYVGYENKEINRYIFICHTDSLRKEKIRVLDNEAIYGNWNPKKRKLVAI